jgi:hypothetical protein
MEKRVEVGGNEGVREKLRNFGICQIEDRFSRKSKGELAEVATC